MLPRVIKKIQRTASRPILPVTIQQLLGRSTGVTDESHLRHAQWIQKEMPVRLAHRLADFLQLPFVVVCNTRFHEVFRVFLLSFETLSEAPPIQNQDDVQEFAKTLRGLVTGFDEVVHMLQEGHGELSALLGDLIDLDTFLNKVFITRIGNRVLAEHFLHVHEARQSGTAGDYIGIVHPNCRPAEIVDRLAKSLCRLCNELYGRAPKVVLSGELETELTFVPDHLDFMLQEILKNALRATLETHPPAAGELPPVTIEIMKGFFDVMIKVSDCGGGMRPERMHRIWRYGYTTSGREPGASSLSSVSEGHSEALLSGLTGQDRVSLRQISGYGFGLPLSRVYAQYFGGDLHVQSMHGYGTDVYLNINHLGDVHEVSGIVQKQKAQQRARLAAS